MYEVGTFKAIATKMKFSLRLSVSQFYLGAFIELACVGSTHVLLKGRVAALKTLMIRR